ncbi:MAG: DUF1800 family protein, partial [Woeseiaceae bacterium]
MFDNKQFKWIWTNARTATTLVLALLLTACGGSGGGDGGGQPPVEPPAPPTVAELNEASRLAAQATFGMDFAGIDSIARQGHENWIDGQFNVPMSDHLSIVADIVRRREAGEFAAFEEDIEYLIFARRLAWWHRAVTARDELRQRVGFALSEIFVVSDSVDILIVHPDAL